MELYKTEAQQSNYRTLLEAKNQSWLDGTILELLNFYFRDLPSM